MWNPEGPCVKASRKMSALAWRQRYSAIGQIWRRAWNEVIPFFAFPDDVRKIIFTTNAIGALNSKLESARLEWMRLDGERIRIESFEKEKK